MTKALIVVDVQQDFCEGGSLAVTGGNAVAAGIRDYIKDQRASYEAIVFTRDWHINPGEHWSLEPDYISTWPVHCAAGTDGSNFHELLNIPQDAVIFSKGQFAAAYSGFEGIMHDGWKDVDHNLKDYLTEAGVDEIDVCGLATDYCVKATAADGIMNGFKVNLLPQLCAAVDPVNSGPFAIKQLEDIGVNLVTI